MSKRTRMASLCYWLLATSGMALAQSEPTDAYAPPAPPSASQPVGIPHNEQDIGAYGFRERMSSDPQCQALGQEADRAFINPEGTQEEQRSQLESIAARARRLGCTR